MTGREAFLRAAREARAQLATLCERALESKLELSDNVRLAVAALYRTEAPATDDELRAISKDALDALRGALGQMQVQARSEALAQAMELVARALAVLWPAGRELEPKIDDAADAAPLGLHVRRRRRVLELAPDVDEMERRGRARVTLDVDIGLQSETNFFTGFAEDLSDGGIFIATYQVLPIDTRLVVSFVLPSGTQLTVRGRVVWTREPRDLVESVAPGMGVQFEELSAAERLAVLAFCRQRAPMFYER